MRAATGPSPSALRGRGSDDAQIRLLIVEDDTFQTAVLSQLIGKAETTANLDVTLNFACNSADALRMCEEGKKSGEQFDLVLLDYYLPGGASNTILKPMRNVLGKAPTIIMLSGTAQEEPLRQCLDVGADSYRLKPVKVCLRARRARVIDARKKNGHADRSRVCLSVCVCLCSSRWWPTF